MVADDSIFGDALDNDTLGGRIWRAREAAGLSASSCARALGIRRDTLEGWESDRSAPRANRLMTMAGVLGVTPAWLLYGIGDAPTFDAQSDELKIVRAQLARVRELREQTDKALEMIEKAIERMAERETTAQ
ncbi:MAG: helix-turn-helix domain-containing protein [Rhizobiaceae bacterium]